MLKKLAETLFYGNYFYGFCTVALSAEASVQQGFPLNSIEYYIFLFAITVLYYIQAYATPIGFSNTINQRTLWYKTHKKSIRVTQIVLLFTAVISAAILIIKNRKEIHNVFFYQWILIFIFPIIAVLYYGIVLSPQIKFNLRSNGWIKPFVIGFVWTGAVTIYPIIFYQIESGKIVALTFLSGWYFLKNWMFITLLCIMFDIKDYAADHNRQLKTFVVQIGLRKTIFYIIIPLSLIGLSSFIAFTWANHFPLLRIIINTIPFLLLIIVAYSLHRRKSILYYLVVIDGLMLIKAVCGILGVVLTQ
ncbi:MAG: hypothetical protein ACR2FN_08085 [Chitinophagaceae bacterium]